MGPLKLRAVTTSVGQVRNLQENETLLGGMWQKNSDLPMSIAHPLKKICVHELSSLVACCLSLST